MNKTNKEFVLSKLADIAQVFDELDKPEHSYFVTSVIAKIAVIEAEEGGEELLLQKAIVDMMDVADILECDGLYEEASCIDGIRMRVLEENK